MPDTWDFSPRPRGFNTPAKRESFDTTAGELLRRAELVCRHLLPAGRREGHEFKAGDLYGSRGDSLSINVKTGVWKDFATDDGGGDLISLWAAVKGVRMGDAKEEAETWLGKAPPVPPVERKVDWRSAAPKAPAPAPPGDALPKPDKVWDYVTADGELWCYVHRIDPPGGKKIIRPVMPDGKTKGKPDGLAPLLNLPDILDQQTATIVLVEGEKCVDAIAALNLPGVIATTNISGASSIKQTDWSPLKGRHVIRWPDKDAAGEKWLAATLEALNAVGVETLRDVELDPSWPAKHDAADLGEGERRARLDAAMRSQEPAWRSIADSHFDVDWDSVEPPREYLIDNLIPFGRGGLLAAPGDTGKGMLILDLAVKVAAEPEPGFDANPPTAFGHIVKRHGRVVILSAEDDEDELRRRMRGMHAALPAEIRQRIHYVPYPDLPKRMPHYLRDNHGKIEETAEFAAVVAELRAFDDLALVVMDPISAFFYLDMTTNAASQVVGNTLDKLAKTVAATVLGCHHLTKGDRKTPITTPEEARHAIQGGGQLLNALRFAYALWAPPEAGQRHALETVGRKFEHSQVYRGAMVKANYPADRDVQTYVRNKQGLLEIVAKSRLKPPKAETEEEITTSRPPASIDTMRAIVVASIKQFAEQGMPAKLGYVGYETNIEGPAKARGEWFALMPEDWRRRWRKTAMGNVDRHAFINRMVADKLIVMSGDYLHLPGDDWATGLLDFRKDRKKGRPDPVKWLEDEQ